MGLSTQLVLILYSQMLQEAIEEKQTGIVKADIPDVEISLPVNAYLPDDYIRDGFQKIQMYKRVKAIESEEDYSELVDEMTDRFGDMPFEADLLLRVSRLKVWGRIAGVESIKKQHTKIEIRLSPKEQQKQTVQNLWRNRWNLVAQLGSRWKGDDFY